MEENVLDILGLQLVDYFINFQGYEPYKIPTEFRDEAKGKVYLINKNNKKYQIIKIIKQDLYNANEVRVKEDKIVSILIKKLSLSDSDFKLLILILNNDQQNEFRQSPTMDVIVATPNEVVQELAKIFPSITKTVKVENIDNYQMNEKEDEETEQLSDRAKNWKKINFQNRKFLKDALLKSTNPNLIITWLFFALPIVTFVIFSILVSGSPTIFHGGLNISLMNLVFGASNHNLVFGAYNYWRWLTYPFVQFDTLSLLFSLIMFYRVGRFVEGFYGVWKSLIIWILAIFLTGAIQSTVDNINIMNGFEILVLISIGAMIPIIWNYRLFKTPVMNKIVVTFIFMFLFWMFFKGMQPYILLYWVIAIASGWLIGALVSYHNRKLTIFYVFSPVAIGLLMLFVVLIAVLSPYHHYDNNDLTFATLSIYQHFNIISESFFNKVMSNYFGTPLQQIAFFLIR